MTMRKPDASLSRMGRRGVLLVLSSPSGAGKSALSRLLMQEEAEALTLSVSVTTRPKRPSEVDGIHYHFKSLDAFHQLRDRGELLEWAEVHGNFYATPRAPVEAALAAGKDVLFDIDVQGTLQLYEKMRSDVASIFILPPSIAELQRRLHRRAEDEAAVILKRLQTSEQEIKHWQDYDYVLVNEDLDQCFAQVRAILDAERLKRARNPEIEGLIMGLQTDLGMVLSKPSIV
jgi:guanylate kinase